MKKNIRKLSKDKKENLIQKESKSEKEKNPILNSNQINAEKESDVTKNKIDNKDKKIKKRKLSTDSIDIKRCIIQTIPELESFLKTIQKLKTTKSRLTASQNLLDMKKNELMDKFIELKGLSILGTWLKEYKSLILSGKNLQREEEFIVLNIIYLCDRMHLSINILKSSKIGKHINSLGKVLKEDLKAKKACEEIVEKWREMINTIEENEEQNNIEKFNDNKINENKSYVLNGNYIVNHNLNVNGKVNGNDQGFYNPNPDYYNYYSINCYNNPSNISNIHFLNRKTKKPENNFDNNLPKNYQYNPKMYVKISNFIFFIKSSINNKVKEVNLIIK